MRRKIVFLLPDASAANLMMDELLLSRVDASCIHFYADKDVKLVDLPRADVSEKTEMMLGGFSGIAFGAALGFVAGILALMFPPWYAPASDATILVITTLFGAVTASLWTAVVAVVLPSDAVAKYQDELARGGVLIMVRVPFYRCREILNVIRKRHPKANYQVNWPVDHEVFP